MTLTELKSLTGSQLRILVAEAEGWQPCKHPICRDFNGKPWDIEEPPHYDTDRDDIVDAILRRFTKRKEKAYFAEMLCDVIDAECNCFTDDFKIATASAEDLCRAFLASL